MACHKAQIEGVHKKFKFRQNFGKKKEVGKDEENEKKTNI
jgi:hypothetical protein